MRIKETFFDIQKGRLTTLEKITFVEQVTSACDPVKLELLQKDLDRYIASIKREAEFDPFLVFAECFYEAVMHKCQHNPDLSSITQEQFWGQLAKYYPELLKNKDLLKRAMEIGNNKYGESIEETLADSMELFIFKSMVDEKVKEVSLVDTDTDRESCRPPTYDLEDSRQWISELMENPDYQYPNGSPYYGAIDAELTRRHMDKTGQKPSHATIKNHRRKLKFMQKERGATRVNKG